MDKQAIRDHANFLRTDALVQEHFKMWCFWDDNGNLTECGTPACMAGWLQYRKQGKKRGSSLYHIENEFDLDRATAMDLCIPVSDDSDGINCHDPHIAAQVLDHLADTGEVAWHIFAPLSVNTGTEA